MLKKIAIGVFIFVGFGIFMDKLYEPDRKATAEKQKVEAQARAEEKIKREADLVKKHRIWIGMDVIQLRKSWGRPERINTTATRGGTSEQWVYGHSYVYVEGGVVVAYQN